LAGAVPPWLLHGGDSPTATGVVLIVLRAVLSVGLLVLLALVDSGS